MDLEIPARSVQLIVGSTDSPSADATVMLVEPLDTLPHQLHVSCSLNSCYNNQVTIQILNVSPSPVTIYKGMSLGKVTPGDDILLACTKTDAPSFDHLHLPHLSETEKSALTGLLAEFSDVFAAVTGPKGCTTAVKHAIPTTGPPIRQPMCRLPEALKATVRTEVQQCWRMTSSDLVLVPGHPL